MRVPRSASPIPWLAVAAATLAGNLGVQLLPDLPGPRWLVPFALLAGLLMALPRLRLGLVVLAAGAYTAFAAGERLHDRLDPALAGVDVELTGWVDDFVSVDAARSVFSLRVIESDVGLPKRVRLSWYDAPIAVEPGMQLALVARLRPPRGLMNPDGFDYERWLLLEGYGATGYVREGGPVTDGARRWAERWLALRYTLSKRITSAFEPDAAALVMALTLGERGGFDEAHWRMLRRTGTSHLVAISGMHIGLLALGSFWLIRRVCLHLPVRIAARDLEIAALVSLSIAVGYAALAGFALPTQRATLMLCVALGVIVARRTVARGDGIAIAVVLVLAFDPLASLTASFWLSFGAVAALLALANVRHYAPHRALGSRLRDFSTLQWRMTFALLPLVTLYFGEVSLFAPLVNLLAIPWFSLVLVPAALTVAGLLALGGRWPPLESLVGGMADITWEALAFASSLSWSAVHVPSAPAWAFALAVAAVALALPWHALPGRRLAWLGLAPMLLGTRAAPAPGQLDVTVLDVGHGLAVLLETASRRVLYDAGPVARSGFDAGAEIVVPMLERRPAPGLDLLVLGHGDADHAGGAAAVRAAFPDAAVLTGPDVTGHSGRECRAGQAWEWDGVTFEVLHPPDGFLPLGNESSCVLRVGTAHRSLLLTGDIERRAEAQLSGAALASDVVIVPHHGSATSSSAAFVAATGAEFAIVSAAHDNRWGFPRAEVRARWEAAGAQMLVTGDAGAVRIEYRGPALEVSTERARRRRYWHAGTTDLPGD